MARPRTFVEAPPVSPLPFGLLSAAVVNDDLTGHAQMGIQYEPAACGQVYETRAACDTEVAAFGEKAAVADVHTGIPLVVGDPFNLYSLFVCNPVGLGPDRMRQKAGESLTLGEGRGVEHALASRLPLAAGAVDLTPGGAAGDALHPIDGLAALEGWSSRFYGGVPTIHVPRAVGTILGSLGGHQRAGARLETKQGALVASGGGYWELAGPPTDAEDPETIQEPVAGEAWLYVTGTVVVHRAPNADATPLVMNRGAGVSGASNDALVLATRPYTVTWECITGAVRVSAAFSGPITGGEA